MQPEIAYKAMHLGILVFAIVLIKFSKEFKRSEAASKFRNTGIQYFAIHSNYI